MSLDVRDRELQLHETNKSLRDLPADELAAPDTRERLAQQAEQEQVNGRRLSNLVRNGEGLLREAMRNNEIGVENLDQWAEMVQVLKDIAENRMPSVADLLKQASQGPPPAANKPNEDTPQGGAESPHSRCVGATQGSERSGVPACGADRFPTLNRRSTTWIQLSKSKRKPTPVRPSRDG